MIIECRKKIPTVVMFLAGLLFFIWGCGADDGTGEPEEELKIYVTSISLSVDDLTDTKETQVDVSILPEDANDQSIKWWVSDTEVAEISATGYLTAKKNGEVTVTALANDQGKIQGTITLKIESFEEEVIPEVEFNEVSVATQAELESAISAAQPGDVILLAGGVYDMTAKIKISKSGTEELPIKLMADPDATTRPVLDFSELIEDSSNQGIQLNADYWYIKGIDIKKAGDNGMIVQGSNNTIEFCTFSENADTGLQLSKGAANNLILNCDSYFNADASLENADGFAAKLDVGNDNKFVGCRAWQNLDDGWDGYLRGADNVSTSYENCWAIKNGYSKDNTVGVGDGNGFKTGGSDDKDLKHNATYKNCIAVGNTHDGFDHNSNRGAIAIYNSASYSNGTNYNFSSSNIAASLTVKNSVAVGSLGSLNATVKDITSNSWQDGLNATVADYESLDVSLLLADRKADGSLPDVNFMKLKLGSDLIDAGIDVGLPINGTASDIGPFEF